MVYAYIQDVPIDEDLYWKVIEEIGSEPLAGSLLHLCVRREDGGLRYIEVWESKELCGKAFDERVHPAVDRAFGGERPQGEPTQNRLEVIDARGALIPEGIAP
ncbi:MAG: hypothetical protein H0W01_07290 [Pseudonocardiales bacterium]|nr:hypothetical protein [Pseudonocardiales bacterium]